MSRAALAVAWLGAGTTAAAAQAPERAKALDTGAAAQGEVVYRRYCAACHGQSGDGNGPLASELRTRPPDLTRFAADNSGVFPFDRLARSIDGRQTPRVHGNPDMPVWGEVFAKTEGTAATNVESAVERITHYVWSIQKPSPE